jgi:hypothetical protein
MSYYKLLICYDSNDRVVPKDGSRTFGLPCRFPARPSILFKYHDQAIDPTPFSVMGTGRKNFFPGFPYAAGKRRAM